MRRAVAKRVGLRLGGEACLSGAHLFSDAGFLLALAHAGDCPSATTPASSPSYVGMVATGRAAPRGLTWHVVDAA